MEITQNIAEQDVKKIVWEHAKRAAEQGAGYAQEGVVMRQIADELGIRWNADLKIQHWVLDAWHDLFASKKLGWGYNLDNPNSPFFHVRNPD
ncbi:hypothetical protein KIH39_23880 [Telmatocola sphagniphila]|jgi:hypothetical protein|uniref:Uncharacterized protein n=1 Tax=Telmatocola sphagniphila TaxID=1123043 RepID=A0A8E6B5V6_9BACT|nr:hypothetical protein [Telmatocola sphagniphila]QVL31839.1 hypothetical protein KIH39_23880 [Telmatocola sphagniphila]